MIKYKGISTSRRFCYCHALYLRIPTYQVHCLWTLLWLTTPILDPINRLHLGQVLGVSPDLLIFSCCWLAKIPLLWCTAALQALRSLSNSSQLPCKLALCSIICSMFLYRLICLPCDLQPCPNSLYNVCFGSRLSGILPICPIYLTYDKDITKVCCCIFRICDAIWENVQFQ